MSTLTIFVLGLVVTGLTIAAAFLIGVSEAADPAHSRPDDLSPLERSLVGHLREDLPDSSENPE
jgi:hypothetical protein